MAGRYVEPARSYLTTAVLAVAVAGGFLLDLLVLGGGRVHALAWALGAVVVVGFDALVVTAARGLRSITVDDDTITVGEATVPRADVVGVAIGDDDAAPVLGRRHGEGLPKGTAPLTLQLRDGTAVVVATRHPDRLAAAIDAAHVLPEIRPAEPEDLVLLPDIDERAESLFRVSGMNLPDLPFPVDALHEARAVFVAGRPAVAFVQLGEVDGAAHVQELAVVPSHMRRGVGTALLEAACAWARGAGYDAITLTTYADVAWNGPFYASRGWTEVDDPAPELAEIRVWERDIGLDAAGRRIAMRRDLRADPHRGVGQER